MRTFHYLLALPLGLTILACQSQPEQQLVASFVDAVQKSDENALGRVSLVPFEEKVEAWEIVEVSAPTTAPFQLKAMREERVEIKKKLDEMISARLRLDQINEAFDSMRAGEAARSVIVFES